LSEINDKTNVDAQEIAKFEALASRWWDPNSEFKPLHQINPLRLHFIDLHASLAGKSVLDIGCGGGLLTEGMAHRGARVTGIDMGKAPIQVAKLHCLESGLDIDYRRCSAEALASQHQAENLPDYQVITCLEMLEHVPDPLSVIQSAASMLAPGGKLFLSTLNRNPKSYLFAIIGAEYLLKLLPRGTHDYRKFIRPSELAHWIREAGLHLKASTGMTYNPLSREYRLNERDLDVNYLMVAEKPYA